MSENRTARNVQLKMHAKKMAAATRRCPDCGRMIRASNLERHIKGSHR